MCMVFWQYAVLVQALVLKLVYVFFFKKLLIFLYADFVSYVMVYVWHLPKASFSFMRLFRGDWIIDTYHNSFTDELIAKCDGRVHLVGGDRLWECDLKGSIALLSSFRDLSLLPVCHTTSCFSSARPLCLAILSWNQLTVD